MDTRTIDQQRLERVAQITLGIGSHSPPNGAMEACVMEAVSYVAGEDWSDSPQCACPVIAQFLRSWNDGIRDDEKRTLLLRPLIPRLVGTRSTPEVELQRSYLALDWLARVQVPAWLDAAGLTDHAQLCRDLGALCDVASCETGLDALRAARAAAWDAAGDAAGAAARERLVPTVESLQRSALDLVERMIAVTEVSRAD